MVIVTVLKQSKEFNIRHAQWLHRQFDGYPSYCITNIRNIEGVNTIPLRHNWPCWWSKIEVFNPYDPIIGKEDILYFDIDSVIVGDITPLTEMKKMTLLTDFSPAGISAYAPATGLMFIPASDKKAVWDAFTKNPQKEINAQREQPFHGDQGFIGKICLHADRWQDILPGKIVSYKCNIATKNMIGFDDVLFDGKSTGKVPEGAIVVCFHGNPRPWNTSFPWVPKFSIINTFKSKTRQIKKNIIFYLSSIK